MPPVDFKPNIWYLRSVNEVMDFLARGGRVVVASETADSLIKVHPYCVPASVLLPQYDAVNLYIEGNIGGATWSYGAYLQTEEPDLYVCAILAAVVNSTPIGIYFGEEELEAKFGLLFCDYLASAYGIIPGCASVGIYPNFNVSALPVILNKLYLLNLINFGQFMTLYPNIPINPTLIPKMAYEMNPPVMDKTNMQEYYDHFEWIRKSIFSNGGRYLRFPLVAEGGT